LVEGEGRIGKNRLLREFAGSSQRLPVVAACPPFREPYTLGPVVDAMRQATDRVAGLGLSDLAGALRPLFPEWRLTCRQHCSQPRTRGRPGTDCSAP
jgi:hypothetical protein